MSPSEEIAEITRTLYRAGWWIGDLGYTSPKNGPTWVVWGSNGENLIKAKAPTKLDAWRAALGQGRAVAMPLMGGRKGRRRNRGAAWRPN